MRIWFNRGFSLAPIAEAMRRSDPALDVVISVGSDHPLRNEPAAVWIEPDSDDDYVAWAAAMVAEHRVDVLIPTRCRERLAQAELACRVELPASPAVLDLLDDKYAFAEAMAGEAFHLDTRLVTSTAELTAALDAFAGTHPAGAMPCVKPRRGVNGHGFWRLLPDQPMSHLHYPESRRIMDRLYVAATAAAEAAGSFRELVLMEYLPGPEVSVDVLARHGMLLRMAARTKLATGGQHIQTDHELAADVAGLIERFHLHGVVNVQFRRAADGRWRVLEINTRPAGGIVYSETVGCGLLAAWAAVLTGRTRPADVGKVAVDAHIRLTTAITPVTA